MVSKWCPSAKRYDLFPLLWFGNGARVLRSAIFCRCVRFRSGAPVLRRTRLVLFVVSKWCPSAKKYDLLLVVSKWWPSAKKHDLLPLFIALEWYRSAKNAKKYDLLSLFVVSKYDLLPLFMISDWSPGAKKYYLLPVFVVSEWCPQC